HQKKLMLGVKRLKELQRGESGSEPPQSPTSPPSSPGGSTSSESRREARKLREGAPSPLAKPRPGLTSSQTPPHTPTQTPPQTPPHGHTQQASPRARPRPSTQTSSADGSVPLLRLPCEEEERRRTHSLIGSESDSRYATVCRSSSTHTAAPNDVTVNRSQSSVTLRPRRKGRPPTPPKRSCSSITGGDGEGEGQGVGLLGLPTYRERRASDCGSLGAALRAQDSAGLQRSEGTSGSVRSLAAMLETSMVPRNVASGANFLQQRPEPRPRSIVVTSGSEITDGTATLRRKPRPPATETEGPTSAATTVITMTTGSETIRRRPRTTEQAQSVTHSNNQSNSPDGTQKNVGEPQQNGGVVLRRRPVSEASERTETGRETCEWMEARKSLKPPVSPKPSTVALRKTQADPPTPTRRVPIPGPENMEPAQSPAQSPSTPSPHPVKPPRSSIAGLSIDLLGGREAEEEEERRKEKEHQRKTEQEKEESKRAEDENQGELERKTLRRGEAKEESQEEGGQQEEMIQHRLEETSASLAAALQTVEHKIKEEDRPNDKKAAVSILDDIGSMFDDLADQLDAMLD
ncbi:hypothetical protein GOODEAATRI_003036, partial [Goodea atripinnis]